MMQSRAIDESIVSFASVRLAASSSDPSFGDWRTTNEQIEQSTSYSEETVPAYIEVSRGSPNKYELEKETGQLVLDRVLHSAVYYPGDYGYVPQTLCGDGDPLDILIIAPAESGTVSGLDPGVMANCRVVGVMDMEDESGHDEKIIAVLENCPATDHIADIEQVPEHLQREIQHFFENYKVLEKKNGVQKWAKVLGWGGKAAALDVVKESRRMYADTLKCDAKLQKLHSFVQVNQCPNILHVEQQEASFRDGSAVTCFVNVTKGTMNAYTYRHDTTYRHFKYALSMPYPGDYGIICQTYQKDTQKPIEVLILSTFPISAEVLVDVRIIGGLERSYMKGAAAAEDSSSSKCSDFKLFAVLGRDPRMNHVHDIKDLNPKSRRHYESFFVHSAEVADFTDVSITRWMDRMDAMNAISEAHASYLAAHPDRTLYNTPNLACLPWTSKAMHGPAAQRVYPAYVEASKHTSNRYSFDMDVGVLKCFAPLKTASFWPGNFGFIPQTVAEDNRPVDVMILSNVPLMNSTVADVRIVGAAECIDEMGPDVKLIAVPNKEPRMKEWDSVEHVPKHIKDEMVHFFNAYKDLESDWKFCRFERWMTAEEAQSYLQQAHSRFFLFSMPMRSLEKRIQALQNENSRLNAEIVSRLK